MPRQKGYQDKRNDPNALRKVGWRPTMIRPEFEDLVNAIAASRGWSKSHVLEMALTQLATPEEVEAAAQK